MPDITIPTRVCSKCKVEKPVTEYDINCRGNYDSWCIPCYKAYMHEYDLKRKERNPPKFEYDGVSTKICDSCGKDKPLNEYRYRRNMGKISSSCKECLYAANKVPKRNWELKKKYGITREQLEGGLYAQGYRCMICFVTFDLDDKYSPKKPNVDHNEKTGKTRGILCTPCNMLLGMYKEDIETLKACGYFRHAEYLERFK